MKLSPAPVLIVLALSGCGGKDPAAARERCAREAGEIGAYLRSMDRDAGPLSAADLALRDDATGAPPWEAPIVAVHPDSIVVDGSTFGAIELTRAGERLRARHQDAVDRRDLRGGREQGPDRVIVAIDADVEWGQAAAVLATVADAGLTEVTLAFARTARPTPPPAPSVIDADLDAIAALDHDKATRFAQVAQRVVERCDALVRVFGEVASVDDKTEHLLAGLAPALIECKCRADLPSVRALFYRLLHVEHPASWLAVTLDPAGEPGAADDATPWREIGPRLRAGARLRVRL